jgi:hypothetical protein
LEEIKMQEKAFWINYPGLWHAYLMDIQNAKYVLLSGTEAKYIALSEVVREKKDIS